MAIAVNDIWHFALDQRLFGQQVINTFALRITATTGSITEASFMNTLFEDIAGYFNQADRLRREILDLQSSDVTHVAWLVKRVSAPQTQVTIMPLATNVTGTINVTAETANTAMSITRKGLPAGRRYRGRVSIAGVPIGSYAAGVFSNNYLADAAGAAAEMRAAPVLPGEFSFEMGWWSPTHSGVVNNQPVVYPALFVAAVDAFAQRTVRVQRSRTVDVGS